MKASKIRAGESESPTLSSFVDLNPKPEDFRGALLQGFCEVPKKIPSKFFYDDYGSELFEEICKLEEYYPTRTEIGILQEHREEIADLIGETSHLIELGSGASKKIRILLNELQGLSRYTAVDISRDFLIQSAEKLASDYPYLDIAAVCADYTKDFYVPDPPSAGEIRRVAFFPGSTIGNFDQTQAELFLTTLGRILGPESGLLIGIDLEKESRIIEAAYNDLEGITAKFNLNLLNRANREIGTDFDVSSFRHQAVYVEPLSRIEMRLVSEKTQSVQVEEELFDFATDEYILTEISQKFNIEEFKCLAARSGYKHVKAWSDEKNFFGVHFLVAED